MPPRLVAGDERERAAAVDQRVRGHVVGALDDQLEERPVGDEEEDVERAGEERDDVQLRPRQMPDRVGDRHRRDQQAAPDVGRDHHLAPAAAPVDPHARVQREDQVRHERGGEQRAHLRRRRVECEDGGQWQRDQRDLVADQRHRLPDEVAAEVRVLAQERRQHRRIQADGLLDGGVLVEVATPATRTPGPQRGFPVRAARNSRYPMSTAAETIETKVPKRLDRLPWSRWHWLVVFALGFVWILDGLEVTIVGSIGPTLQKASIHLSTFQVGLIGAVLRRGRRLRRALLRLPHRPLRAEEAVHDHARASTWSRPWRPRSPGTRSASSSSASSPAPGSAASTRRSTSAIDELIPARVRGWVDLAINGSWWIGTAAGAADHDPAPQPRVLLDRRRLAPRLRPRRDPRRSACC